ncbi:hypothetical protein BJ944DRAFT_87321 [Cunninghamella echinulata]|nr:hypothetical protein BJ944DRAFT_87321 [Cunninghamella echinulata]
MIYQNAETQQPIIIDNREKCSCPELNHDHSKHSSPTNPSPTSSPPPPSSSSSANNNSGSSVNTCTSSSSSSPLENYSSWAVVAPQQDPYLSNQDPVNLGFIFHKSSSQRYLNGQPRPPRKKSIKKQQRPSSPHQQHPLTNINYNTPSSCPSSSCSVSSSSSTVPIKNELTLQDQQHDFLLPLMDLDQLSTTTTMPTINNNNTNNNNNNNNNIYDYDHLIPTSTADLNAILNNVLKPMQQEFKSEEEHMNQELANLDLTTPASSSLYNNNNNNDLSSSRSSSISISNMNNMIPILPSSPSNSSTTTTATTTTNPFFPTMNLTTQPSIPSSSSSASSSASASFNMTSTTPYDQMNCCIGSHHPCYGKDSSSTTTGSRVGESVVITITPLNESHHPLQNTNQVRTRIVTCYCGSQCRCQGCLVHPGNFLIGDQLMDPFHGFPTNSSTCPSSTASSTYSVSDDEDHFHLL